jgi:hypothetical protein
MTNVLMRVLLSSGNYALYDVQPNHVPRDDIPQSIEWPVMYGTQIAHESQGLWFYPNGWNRIEDEKLCIMFNNCAKVEA